MAMSQTNDLENDSFTLVINDAMDTCAKCFLSTRQRKYLMQLLSQLQTCRIHNGCNDSSIPTLLHSIGTYLEESHLSHLPLPFYLEQLRIEEIYLGHLHPDLADTLNRIGEVHASNDQFSEANKYFTQALFLLKTNKRRGKLCSLILYNIGLLQYHHSLLIDAIDNFNLSVKERQNYLGEFHPNVAETHLNIGKLLLEIGYIDTAMDNFLKALLVMRVNMGNNSSKVSEILYHIGLSHQINGEYDEALISFSQYLDIMNQHFDDYTFAILILHKMSETYQCMEDIESAIGTFRQIIQIIKQKVGENHICIAVVLCSLRNLYAEQGMIEKSKKATGTILAICRDMNERSYPEYRSRDDFTEFINELFGYIIEDTSVLAAAAA